MRQEVRQPSWAETLEAWPQHWGRIMRKEGQTPGLQAALERAGCLGDGAPGRQKGGQACVLKLATVLWRPTASREKSSTADR